MYKDKYNCMYPYLTFVVKIKFNILEVDTIEVIISFDNTNSKQLI